METVKDKVLKTDEVARQVAAASSLLLNEPDDTVRETLRYAGYHVTSDQELRQSFYNRLGVPQSGLYLPPYEHVFRKREFMDGIWHFPPPQFDGAAAVEMVYRQMGFDRARVPTNAMLHGPNIPADHLGFMLAFASVALQTVVSGTHSQSALLATLSTFVTNHFDDWVDAFCVLLPQQPERNEYLNAVAGAVQDAVRLLRSCVATLRYKVPLVTD